MACQSRCPGRPSTPSPGAHNLGTTDRMTRLRIAEPRSGRLAPMSTELTDTHPAVAERVIEGYRRMTPAEKLACVEELNETVLQFAAARISREHPGIGERELRLRLAALWLDRETMVRAFGWDPRDHEP
jgi:hypothetical protein